MTEERQGKGRSRADAHPINGEGPVDSPPALGSALGRNIARLREAASMTQTALAEQAGLSQSTISKLENSTTEDASFVDLGRIASALKMPLKELVAGTRLASFLGSSEELFKAYCPNPLCRSNKLKLDGSGQPLLQYSSLKAYHASEFDEVNFCEFCGEKLIKECSSCGAYVRTAGGTFCSRCGASINARPTPEELNLIRQILANRTEESIPF